MKDRRVRVVVEFYIDQESCDEHNVRNEDVLGAIDVFEDDVSDQINIRVMRDFDGGYYLSGGTLKSCEFTN